MQNMGAYLFAGELGENNNGALSVLERERYHM